MARLEHDRLTTPRGFRALEAALDVAMLDDLTQRLRADLRGVTPAELGWQPAPGMNTIGMLLAHLAIVEVWWCVGVLEGRGRATPFTALLGIDADGDGMPIAPRGHAPAALEGCRLPYFLSLIARGRAETRRVAAALTQRDLTRRARRTRWDGKRQEFDPRWVLYHLVEHFAGHHGQILLLRHMHRARRRGAR